MRHIGRYAILGLLGRGGMGAVYKAAMPRVGRTVAMKVLAPSEALAATADPDALRRGFLREAALMARIRHPAVAQVLDVDEDERGRPFFVMEYFCDNLGTLLGEGYRVEESTRRLDVARSLSLARQLASALARLHHEGILHRDVKPYNMMLADAPELYDGGERVGDQLKLIDFGLSRLRGEVESGRAGGAVVGSPFYASPEQEADPANADARADVFSAGVTLFRCLTGRLPQEGVPASRLRVGLDGRFDDFFARCCAGDPAKRPPSAEALLAELTDLAGHWERLRAAACGLPPEVADKSDASGRVTGPRPASMRPAPMRAAPMRAAPVLQRLQGAREAFGLDELWRPARNSRSGPMGPMGPMAADRFVALDAETVRDEVGGLVWQRGGGAYPTNLARAREYARELDERRFAGRGGWRLPTVEELRSLLAPETDLRGLCPPGVFDASPRRLWSADAKSHAAGWYADVEHGFIWWRDVDCEIGVRCVTSEA